MLRRIFFSDKLPRTWEWYAVRETLLIFAAFTLTSVVVSVYTTQPDASMEVKTTPVGIMALFLTQWFWMVKKYSFVSAMVFGWGISFPASLLVAPPDLWLSIGLSIISVIVAIRAYSTGPRPVASF